MERIVESESGTVAEPSLSRRVSDSFGFAIFEFMESLVEPTVANALQVGEPSTLVVGDEPPVLADVVVTKNVPINFSWLFCSGTMPVSYYRFARLETWHQETVMPPRLP